MPDNHRNRTLTHETFLTRLLPDTLYRTNVVECNTIPAEQTAMDDQVPFLVVWRKDNLVVVRLFRRADQGSQRH